MNLIKPKKLQKGDTIGLLSVSGNVREIENIKKAEKYFNNLGYKTVISETTYKKNRYNAGTEEERIKVLESFFANKEIDAIVCTRGGYGTLRMVNDINYEVIKKNPKIFCGYSDITVLLLMILKKTGLVTFHGAMANGDFGIDNISPFTEKSFFYALTGQQKDFYAGQNGKIIKEGSSEGMLWGGNLATIASMIGLDFVPNEKFILFIEDVNEPAYKIDRMLIQLFNDKNIRENIAGLAVGEFSDIDKIQYVDEVLGELAGKYNIPCCRGFNISHERDKFTLPVGISCKFSADDKIIRAKEVFFDEK